MSSPEKTINIHDTGFISLRTLVGTVVYTPEEVRASSLFETTVKLEALKHKLGREIHFIPIFVNHRGAEDITFFTKDTQIIHHKQSGEKEIHHIKSGEVVIINTHSETLEQLAELIEEKTSHD